MIEFYDYGRGVVPTRKTAGLPLLFCVISRSVSRPAEVRPWEVRFAHPCRARARHPIHKAMGGHASHGRTSDRAFIRLGWSVSPNNSRRRKKRDRRILLDLLITCERPKRRQTFPFSLGRCHAVTEGYETARP